MAENTAKTQSRAPVSVGGSGQGVKIIVVMVFVLLISAGILFLASTAIESNRVEALNNQEKRLGLLAHGRAEVFQTWLRGLTHQGDRLIKSDLFRLYAAEVDLIEGDLAAVFGAVPMGEAAAEDEGMALAEQLPMMQNMLREFSTYAGFLNARILSKEGQAYIATDGHLPPMSETQINLAKAAVADNAAHFSPLRKTPIGIEMDIYVPIHPPDAEEGDAAVGSLMMTRQLSGKITELLSNSALSTKGERTRFMQKTNGIFKEVTPWTAQGFADVVAKIDVDKDGNIAFGERRSLSDPDRMVFSVGMRIAGPQWWIVQESDYDEAMLPIREFEQTVYVLAGFGILTALLIAGLAWWVLTGVQSKRVAEEFRHLAEQIDDQKRFIDSINANIDEFITLKDLEGKFTYVNDAFAAAAGRDKHELIGMDSAAVFGFDTAKRLCASDDMVTREDRKITINEPVFLRSNRYQFQISKSPYHDASGKCMGIVEVYRDITEFVAVQEKNRRLIQRAMEALGATIEAADPYLGGHTKLLAGLSVEVAKVMHLSEMDIAEVETAANLSQIGKMFVDNEILTKPGKLTDEEMSAMEKHVEHAYRILKDIDIGEGVLKAIYQMNERIDGSGYPKKLRYDEIILLARILSALNVFCAMIRPRAYRGAKDPQQALDILLSETSKFDAQVLDALSEVLKTPVGEKLLDVRD